MIKKQDLLNEMAGENLNDEEVMAIINKYPDELSSDDVAKLDAELKKFEADNALLAKAYDELATEFDDQAQLTEDTMDDAIAGAAKMAHDDLTWAANAIKE